MGQDPAFYLNQMRLSRTARHAAPLFGAGFFLLRQYERDRTQKATL